MREPAKTGVKIYGLYLQGAKYELKEGCLDESDKGVLFVEMPIIWLEPVLMDVKENPLYFICPLYKTSVRAGTLSTTGHSTNFILFLVIPNGEQVMEHWIRRGVAMLCLLDE